jgi:hypothetical protein
VTTYVRPVPYHGAIRCLVIKAVSVILESGDSLHPPMQIPVVGWVKPYSCLGLKPRALCDITFTGHLDIELRFTQGSI